MNKFCGKCGTPLAEDEISCGKCGAKVEAQAEPIPPTPVQHYRPQQPNSDVPAAAPKKNKTGLVLGILGGVIAAAIIVIVLLVPGVLGGTNEVVGTWYNADDMVAFDSDGIFFGHLSDSTVFQSSYTVTTSGTGVISAPSNGLEDAVFSLVNGALQIECITYYSSLEEAGCADNWNPSYDSSALFKPAA